MYKNTVQNYKVLTAVASVEAFVGNCVCVKRGIHGIYSYKLYTVQYIDVKVCKLSRILKSIRGGRSSVKSETGFRYINRTITIEKTVVF